MQQTMWTWRNAEQFVFIYSLIIAAENFYPIIIIV